MKLHFALDNAKKKKISFQAFAVFGRKRILLPPH
jgi:hypothetical protein